MLKYFLQNHKNELRQRLKNLRNTLTLHEKENGEKVIMAKFLELYAGFTSFGAYYPINSEVTTLKIIKSLQDCGKTITLPVISNNKMAFKVWPKGQELVSGKFSLEPPANNKAIVPEIILTPLLGFDRAGNRLGYGHGYYDKYFTSHAHVQKVGLAFAIQEIASLPSGEWDKKLDLIITDREVIKP